MGEDVLVWVWGYKSVELYMNGVFVFQRIGVVFIFYEFVVIGYMFIFYVEMVEKCLGIKQVFK